MRKTVKRKVFINISCEEHAAECQQLAKKLREKGVRVVIRKNNILNTGITIKTPETERIIVGEPFFEVLPHIPNMF